VVVDDGARVWIDENLVIDGWKDQATIGLSYDMELVKGEKYPSRIEYYDGKIGGKIRFLWQTEFPLELIPTSQLHPAETNAELVSHQKFRLNELPNLLKPRIRNLPGQPK
jgi:beta-glucosidase